MSMLQEQQIQTSVYLCTFQCFIRQANITMKFPCTYFVEWRTINSKSTVKTDRHAPHENQVNFDTRISLQLEMLFDHSKLQFLKRETIVELFLVSKSRPDQNKLVGRVNIDLGKVINVGMYEQPTEFKLNFCSIDGSLVMQFHPLEQRLTSLTIQDLDKSSFIDFISQTSLKTQNRNQSAILTRQQNHSLQKAGRSDIRALSPGSPKSIIKSGTTAKGTHSRFDQQIKKTSSIKEAKAQFTKFLNDQFEAKNKVALNGSKVNVQADFLMQSHNIALQSKNSEQKRPSEYGVGSRTRQDEIVNSQNSNFNNIFKTSSSPMLEQTLKENIHIDKKDSSSNLLVSHKQETVFLQQNNQQNSFKQEHNQTQVDNQNLKHQVIKLLQQNQALIQEKEKSDRKLNETVTMLHTTNTKINDIEQQLNKKNKIIEKNNLDFIEKQNIIKYLQDQINHLSSITQKQDDSYVDSLKATISLLEAQNKELNENINKIRTQFQKKLINSEQIIRKMEKESQQYHRSMKTQLQALQAENIQLINNLQEARKELEDRAHSTLKQSVDIQRQAKERSELEMRLQSLTNQLTEVSLKYDQAEKDLAEIQGKYLQLENLYDEQVSANQLLNIKLQDLATLKENAVEVAEQAVVLNRSVVIESLDHVQTNEDNEKLRIENEQLLNEVQFLKSQKELTQQQHKNVIQSLQQENESMRQQLKNLQEKLSVITKLQGELNHLQTENAQVLSDNRILKQQITLMSRALDENQQRFKIIQQQNDNYRQQAKVFEAQVSFYEKELLMMKDEIVRIRQNRQGKQDKMEYEEMISKLNANLEEQINQNNELSQTIVRYMEKQAKMKQTLAVLQMQSKEIFTLVQQKEKNEQTYQKAIQQLQTQILNLKNQQNSSPSPSPTHNYNRQSDYSPQKQKILEDNAELMALIKQLQETNSKLNEQLMQISVQYNESKTKLQEEILHLTQSLIAAENSIKREENSAAKIKEYERTIKNKDIELDILKSRNKQREAEHRTLEIEVSKLRTTLQEIQEEKFNLESTINEKDIKILQLQEEITSLKTTLIESPSNTEARTDQPNHNLAHLLILNELKDKLLQKSLNSDWDSLLQSILQRSMGGQDPGRLLNLQQKSRLLSKQLQKMKAQLLKSQWRNQQQKVAMMGLFKKCESIVAQLIAAAESLNQNQSSFL